jgi:sialic acid synthase SpsE
MVEIICEIGQNFAGDLEYATNLICAAKDNGADVVKFQLFDTDKIFSPLDKEYYFYMKHSQLSFEEVTKLTNICSELDIEFMASVFDLERLEWLEKLGVKRYKLASRSIHDLKLIAAIKATGKPIIASLGLWKGKRLPNFKAKFLYCVSEYPAMDVNLTHLDFCYRYQGFSDHTIGINKAIEAVDYGAGIIEKHFTFYKDMYGPDNKCSMTPRELRRLREYCDNR